MVTGVDLSKKLLEAARQQDPNQTINFIQDDAQVLGRLDAEFFDAVLCNLALMDIPDIQATFQAVHRTLKQDGCFVFAILHPGFETPFRVPEDLIETDGEGNFVAVRVMHYLQEGYWNSGGDGMRGRVGAYHRTLSTYLNTLLDCDFQLVRLMEPALPGNTVDNINQKDSHVPSVLVVKALV